MAHLALTIDDDRQRRDRFAGRVRALFANLPDVVIGDATAGSLTVVWAHAPRAPVSIRRSGDAFAILLGYAIDDEDRWITASDLAARWRGDAAGETVFDGYHVGVVWDATRGLAAGVDPCGLFPLYHGGGPAVLVATTPEAFRCHEGFTERVDREGLAGILLVHGPLDDRPLVSGIRRLARGHRLSWSRGVGLGSRAVHRLLGTPPPVAESPADAERRIEAEFARAIRRHRPADADTSILLSGGLDSRLVAGCLAEVGAPTRAVILGEPEDHEVIAGRAVAERLGMPYTVVPTDACVAEFVGVARGEVRFNHVQAGPPGDDIGLGLARSGTTDPFVWSGIAYDWVFEPISANNGRDPVTGEWSFENLLVFMNRWGIRPHDLAALLGRDGPELLATLTDRLRAACLAGPEESATASAWIRWDQRMRNHVAMALHATTFTSWPLVPATDRRFFAAVLGLPVAAYADRRLERALLTARYPELATIPLDTNSFRFEPASGRGVAPASFGRLVASARKRLRRGYWRTVRGFDPRRYQRLFNVDHPRWLAVRRAAEPLRPRLHELLDAATLARMLPGPDARFRHRDPVTDGSPIRLLLGLALWFGRPAS